MSAATDHDPTAIDVSERLPAKLSPSAADTYAQCPRQFYYKYILGIRTPGTIHTFRGTLVHTALERLFDHPPAERTAEVAARYLPAALAAMQTPYVDRGQVDDPYEIAVREADNRFTDRQPHGSRTERRALDEADALATVLSDYGDGDHDRGQALLLDEMRTLVANYFHLEDPRKFTPAARELYVQARTAGVPLHGVIDRLDRVTLRDGRQVLVLGDYKTGKLPNDRFLEDKFFQLKVYALLLRAIEGETPRMLRLIYVKGDTPDAVKRRVIDDAELDRTAATLKRLWTRITASARANQWPTRTSPLCPWCDFQPVCPAFNDQGDALLLAEERELYGLDPV